MKKIEAEEILPIESYEKIRNEFRERIMKIKEPRRVHIGPYLTFLFENRETMKYQIQEMLRSENIREAKAVQHEIDTYNQLVPGKNEITATLLIELQDPAVRAVKLAELRGLEKHLFLLVDGEGKTEAEFDEEQIDTDKISSVQYIRFRLGEKAEKTLPSAHNIEIMATHPACSYRESLSKGQIKALKEDFLSN